MLALHRPVSLLDQAQRTSVFGGNAARFNVLGALVLLGVLGRLEADHLHIACRAQVRDHAVTVEVHGHRLGVNLAVAVEVNRLVGGLTLVQEASRAGAEAARSYSFASLSMRYSAVE